MKEITLQYGAIFGKGDSSDWIEYEIELTDEEEKLYDAALESEEDLNEVESLKGILERAYAEIEEIEIQNLLDIDDEYTLECQGESEVDAEEINDLVHDGDEHAISFFGLEGLSEEELEEWDANDLDDLPLIKDFVENFEPESPFDCGWILKVEFPEPEDEEDF